MVDVQSIVSPDTHLLLHPAMKASHHQFHTVPTGKALVMHALVKSLLFIATGKRFFLIFYCKRPLVFLIYSSNETTVGEKPQTLRMY